MSIRKPIVVRDDGSFEVIPDNDALGIPLSSVGGNLATLEDDGLLVKLDTPLEVQITSNVSSISNTGEVTIPLNLPSEFKITEGKHLMCCVEYSPTTVPPAGNGLIATMIFPRETAGTYDSKVLFGPIPAKRAKIVVGYIFGKAWKNPSITITGATSTPIIASNVTVTITVVPDTKVIPNMGG